MVVVVEGAEVTDALDVDDGRAVDADEPLGVELGLQFADPLAQQVSLAPDVQLDVVARGA